MFSPLYEIPACMQTQVLSMIILPSFCGLQEADDNARNFTVSDEAVKEHLAIVKEIRNKAALKSQKMDEQMVKKNLSKNPPSTYSIGDCILMKAPAKNKSSNRVKGKGVTLQTAITNAQYLTPSRTSTSTRFCMRREEVRLKNGCQ